MHHRICIILICATVISITDSMKLTFRLVGCCDNLSTSIHLTVLLTVIPVWDLVYRLLKSKTAEFTFYYLCVQHKGLLRAEVHCHNFGAISMQVTNLRRKAQLWATGKPFKAQHLGAAWVCHGESFLIIAAHVTVSKIQKVRQIWEKHSEWIITIITNSGYWKQKYPSNKWYHFYSIMLLNVWIIHIF